MNTPRHAEGRGVVEAVNRTLGMIAVLTDEGYTIIELLGYEAEVHDEVSWSDHLPLGGGSATNRTKGEVMDVYFQDHHVSLARILDKGYLFSSERYSIVVGGRIRKCLMNRGVIRS